MQKIYSSFFLNETKMRLALALNLIDAASVSWRKQFGKQYITPLPINKNGRFLIKKRTLWPCNGFARRNKIISNSSSRYSVTFIVYNTLDFNSGVRKLLECASNKCCIMFLHFLRLETNYNSTVQGYQKILVQLSTLWSIYAYQYG